MLRKIRILMAVLLFAAITFLFVDFSGIAPEMFSWAAKIQFLPAFFAANFAVVALLTAATIVFGRIYCSVVCPLGVLQDIISRIAGMRNLNRFSYAPGKSYLRVLFLTLFLISVFAGALSFGALIAPYSAYGRIASNVFAPVWALGNNALAMMSECFGNYAFHTSDVRFYGAGIFLVALASLAIVAIMAWKGGRSYCNIVCPVGTVLGFLAKYSLLKPVIDLSKCNSCTLCSRNCKGQCIDAKEHRIDYDRCVMCFDCIQNCRNKAISYTFAKSRRRATEDDRGGRTSGAILGGSSGTLSLKRSGGRRNFFALLFIMFGASAAGAQEIKTDGGLAPIKPRARPERQFKIVPPGAGSLANMQEKCTACQLCVSACPSGVLMPSSSAESFMRPEISYERGYCSVECTECSKVCPAGAILPISAAEKASTQIGRAKYEASRCVVNTDNVQCDNCFRQCPTGAIDMVLKNPEDIKSLKVPVVDEAICIGCGACENLCPARPIAAIYVEGNTVHNAI